MSTNTMDQKVILNEVGEVVCLCEGLCGGGGVGVVTYQP